jgi:hypothetical protein
MVRKGLVNQSPRVWVLSYRNVVGVRKRNWVRVTINLLPPLSCTFSADSPVLWIRVDTKMTLLRQVIFKQPDFQWHYQLRYERDIIAQIEVSQN